MVVYPDLAGRSAAVTGAARGIGLELVMSFARSGMNVQLIDIDRDELAEARFQVASRHPNVIVDTARASVTEPSEISRAMTRLITATGSLDVLVNNAGIAASTPTLNLNLATWSRTIDVNLTGAFVCAQAAGRAMGRQRQGTIINIASLDGMTAAPERAAYCASKAGVVALTKVLAVEWANRGIRVNGIAPGYAETGPVAARVAQSTHEVAALTLRTPAGRLPSAADIANLALFLASDVSSNITGQIIASDGVGQR